MANVTISERAYKRLLAADGVCQEVRIQLSERGYISEPQKVFKLLEKWMNVSGKRTRYKIP